MTRLPDSVSPAGRSDIAHHLHPYTQLRQLEREGPLVIVRGDGVYVVDEHGKRYLEGIGRCWPVSGREVDNEANTPVQTVHADFPHTAYQWSVGSQHYACLPLPGDWPR
jgi:adenosylmethionine-8-amino-7-oxononanoate aminotransferase